MMFFRYVNKKAKAGFLTKLFFLLLLAAITGCEEGGKENKMPPRPVSVVKIQKRNIPVSFEYIAQTESSHLVNIQSRVNGFLDKRVYTEGQMVKAGQVLFLMDKKPFQTQVDAAEASLARQKASHETAKLNLNRVKPLTKLNALSQKDLDDAIGTYESSAAAVEQAKAQLETALLNLSYCTITSPIDGVSGAALQQDGTYINLNDSQLTTVYKLSPIWVNFSLSENQMQHYNDRVKKGILIPPKNEEYEIEIILINGSVFPHKGKITFLQPSFNSKTGTFLIRSTVDNPEGILRPNQYVRTRVKGAFQPNAILIPQRAVHQSSKGHYVFVVGKEGSVELRPVVAGEWQGSDWFINEGLNQDDLVVVDGGLNLRLGEKVQAKPYDPTKEKQKR